MKPTIKSSSVSTPLARRSNRFAAVFAAALFAGLGAASVQAQHEYLPDPIFPTNTANVDGATLAFIQTILETTIQADPKLNKTGALLTLEIPAPSGKTLATDAQFQAAAAAALALVYNPGSTTIPSGVNAASIFQATADLRPASSAKAAVALAPKILAGGLSASTEATDIEGLTNATAGVLAGKNAPAVAAAVITAIANSANAATEDEAVTTDAVNNAPALAAKTVAAALGAIKKTATTALAADIAGAAEAAAVTAAPELQPAVATAAVAASLKLVGKTGPTAGDYAIAVGKSVLENSPSDAATMIQVAAGVAAGAGVAHAHDVQTQVDLDSNSAIQTNKAKIDAAFAGYIYVKTNATVVTDAGSKTKTFLNTPANSGLDQSAVVAGAVAAWLKAQPDIIKQALSSNNVTTSNAGGIITAGVAANPVGAATVAKTILSDTVGTGTGTIATDTAASAIIQGSTVDQVGPIVGAVVKVAFAAGNLNLAVDGAVAGVQAKGYNTSLGSLALNAAKNSKGATVAVAHEIFTHLTNLSANPWEAASAIAGAYAANKKVLLTDINTEIGNSLTGSAAADATTAANLVNAILTDTTKNPLTFFNKEQDALALQTTSDGVLSVVAAVSQANPKALSAIAAEAAVSGVSTDHNQIIAVAKDAAGYKLTPNITTAVSVATHLSSLGSSAKDSILNYVASTAISNPALVPDIAAGATIGAGQYTHLVANAIGFATPAAAGKAVPALFSYSNLLRAGKNGGGIGNAPERASAITAGVVDGVIRANLATQKLQQTDLVAVVAASVKAASTLVSDSSQTVLTYTPGSAGLSGSQAVESGSAAATVGAVSQIYKFDADKFEASTSVNEQILSAVLTAAEKAAGKLYYLNVAQAAAQAIGSLYKSGNGNSYTYTDGDFAALIDALQKGAPATLHDEVKNAVVFGLNNLAGAAGAAGVENYSVTPTSNNYVSSLYNL